MEEDQKPGNLTSSHLGLKYFNFLNLHAAILAAVLFGVMTVYHFSKIRYRDPFEGSNGGVNQNGNANSNQSSTVPFSRCHLFEGKWVKDNESYPLYRARQCSLLFNEFACEKYGRKNLDYQQWSWQPHHCDLPRFDTIKMLEKLRNKRVVFIGDSISRNQWMSMVCLIESSLTYPPPADEFRFPYTFHTFKVLEYNVTIDFHWEPMLLESNGDDPSMHRTSKRIIRNHHIEKHARNWNDADVLVFNSYIWWRKYRIKILLGSFESADSDKVYKDIENLPAYDMALQTWFDWVDNHVNRTKTRVFFVSAPSYHNRAEEWGRAKEDRCFYETEPISKEGHWGIDSDPRMMRMVEFYINKLSSRGFKAQVINITQMSAYRKDGHPGVHKKFWTPLTKELLTTPNSFTDCLHWCLPGVPDVWNQFLYGYLFQS